MALVVGHEDVARMLRAHSDSTSYIYLDCTCPESAIRRSWRTVTPVWPVSAECKVVGWGMVMMMKGCLKIREWGR